MKKSLDAFANDFNIALDELSGLSSVEVFPDVPQRIRVKDSKARSSCELLKQDAIQVRADRDPELIDRLKGIIVSRTQRRQCANPSELLEWATTIEPGVRGDR